MKILFLIEYAVYLFVNIDARINPNFIDMSHSLLFGIYITLLLLELLIVSINSSLIKVHKPSMISIAFMLVILLYLFSIISSYSTNIEIALSIMLITTAYLNGKLINKLKSFKEFLLISFWVPTLVFLLICIRNNINLIELIKQFNIKYLFTNNYSLRLRVEFGFYNVNAAGNLSAFLLCIAFPVKRVINNDNIIHIIEFYIAVLFDICILILTGSRTGIISVLVCYSTIILKKIMSLDFIKKYQRVIVRIGITIVIGIVVVIFNTKDFVVSYVKSRGFAYENVALLSTLKLKIFGIGLLSSGYFVDLSIDNNKGNFLDNYYIYVYVTMGILGLIVIGFTLLYILIGLIKKSKECYTYFLILACYIACIVSGVAETCTMYHLFPSCAVYYSIFFAVLDIKDKGLNKYNYIKSNKL